MADPLILANAPAKTSMLATDKFAGFDASSDEWSAILDVVEEKIWSRFFPQPAANKYVNGAAEGSSPSATTGLVHNTAYFVPFRIRRPLTLTKLCQRVLAVGTALDMAVYASDNLAGRPTGSEICKTGSVPATSANTNIEPVLAGGNISIGYNQTNKPGWFWMGFNSQTVDTLTLRGYPQSAAWLANIFGCSTLIGAAGNASTQCGSGVSCSLPFGTWGDMTSPAGGWAELTGAAAAKCPFPMYMTA